MKHAALCVVVSLMIVSSASAIIRPRYPSKPTPPFSGQVIIIVEDSIQKPLQKAPPAK